MHEGITPGIRRAFVVYLASSNRPIHEVLFTPLRDILHDFEHNFQGMTAAPVPLDALLVARERVAREIQQGLDDNKRRFLPSLAAGAPEWSMLGIAHLEQLRASAGSCTTWRSCRRPMRGHLLISSVIGGKQ